MTISDLTTPQLHRVYRRLWNDIPDGGMFGWDYTTLLLSYPSRGRLIVNVWNEIVAREGTI